MKRTALAFAALLCSTAVAAETPAFPGIELLGADARVAHSGRHIRNDMGEACTYTQLEYAGARFFHRSLPGKTSAIKFRDPQCMQESEVGQMVNIMQINNIITRPYSHNDADWQTRAGDLHDSSGLQKRGQCIQSARYPGRSVAVEYIEQDGAIAYVLHAAGVQGCG